MSDKDIKVGRPRKRDRAGSLAHIHIRVPRRMKAHWQDAVDSGKEFDSVTDLIIKAANKMSGYVNDSLIISEDELNDL